MSAVAGDAGEQTAEVAVLADKEYSSAITSHSRSTRIDPWLDDEYRAARKKCRWFKRRRSRSKRT